MWLGGADEPIEAHVEQEVVFPAGQSRWLNYRLRNQLAGDATASLQIRIDGALVHTVAPDDASPTDYAAMSFQVPAGYLDGQPHTVGFYWTAQAPGGAGSGAMLDDVTLDCSAAPVGRPSAGGTFNAGKRIR